MGVVIEIESDNGEYQTLFEPTNIVEIIEDTDAEILTIIPDDQVIQLSVSEGPAGPPGPAGAGFPAGGLTGQVLSKNSNTDYDTVWANAGSGGASDHGALTGLADDDHPQYLNNVRGDVRYYQKSEVESNFSQVSHTHQFALDELSDVQAAGATSGQVLKFNGTQWAPGVDNSGAGGTSDHGSLTGLADDDHPQYHNDVRGDARYYTKTEVDNSVNTRAPSAHDHTLSSLSDVSSSSPSNNSALLYNESTQVWEPGTIPGNNDAGALTVGRLGIERQTPGSSIVIDYYKSDYGPANSWPASRPTGRLDIRCVWVGPSDPGTIMAAGDKLELET